MIPEQRQAHLRTLAIRLVGLREHLLHVACYRAMGLHQAADYHLEQMGRKAQQLPLAMRRDVALTRYVGGPAQRHLDRLGVIETARQLNIANDLRQPR